MYAISDMPYDFYPTAFRGIVFTYGVWLGVCVGGWGWGGVDKILLNINFYSVHLGLHLCVRLSTINFACIRSESIETYEFNKKVTCCMATSKSYV